MWGELEKLHVIKNLKDEVESTRICLTTPTAKLALSSLVDHIANTTLETTSKSRLTAS